MTCQKYVIKFKAFRKDGYTIPNNYLIEILKEFSHNNQTRKPYEEF